MQGYQSRLRNNTNQSLQHLEYPCRNHKGQICLNYCVDEPCFTPLCSQCIQEHVIVHQNNKQSDLCIRSLRSTRIECLNKLNKLMEELYLRKQEVSPVQSPQQMFKQFVVNLQQIRQKMHESIDKQFGIFQEQFKSKLVESGAQIKLMQDINQNLERIIEQLKEHQTILLQGKYDPNYKGMVNIANAKLKPSTHDMCQSVEKVLRINEIDLIDKFNHEVSNYDDIMKSITMTVTCDYGMFKNAIWQCLKVQKPSEDEIELSKVSKLGNYNNQYKNKSTTPKSSRITDSRIDKLIPNTPNNYKILHFFETGSNKLHLIQVKGDKHIRTETQLKDFIVPSFHASLLSELGYIFLSGGTIQLPQPVKSMALARFTLKNSQFKMDYAKVTPRSSHSLCEDGVEWLYILGGLGQDQDEENTIVNEFERVNIKNGKIERLPKSKWGGANISLVMGRCVLKICEEGVESFQFQSGNWITINVLQDYSFHKGSGYFKVSDTQILIYGGYNDDEQGVDDCSLWILNNKSIKCTNLPMKLPVSEGFWNNQGISDGKYIYALQNIEEEDGVCSDYQRRILRFDGHQWKDLTVPQQI